MCKSKIISLALSIMMILAIMVPVSAADLGTASDYGDLVLYEGGGITVEALDEAVVDEAEMAIADNEKTTKTLSISPMASIRNTVGIRQIQGFPLIYCLEDDAVYYFGNIYEQAYWSVIGQSESLRLSPARTAAMYTAIENAIASLNDGKTYYHAGWRMVAQVELSAQRPRYVEYTPTATCYTGTDTRKTTIPYQYCTLTIDEWFAPPSDNLTEHAYVSCTGNFWFYYDNGGSGGAMMGAGIVLNTNS